MKLTVTPVNVNLGFYRVKLGRKTLTGFVLPSYMVSLGLPPTRNDVIGAIQQVHPDMVIPEDATIAGL